MSRSRTQVRRRQRLVNVGRQLVSLAELAVLWSCDRSTVSRTLESAGIRPYYLGGIKRYPKDEVDAFMESRRGDRLFE